MSMQLLKKCLSIGRPSWRYATAFGSFTNSTKTQRFASSTCSRSTNPLMVVLAATTNRLHPPTHHFSTRTAKESNQNKDITFPNVLEQLRTDVTKLKRVNAQSLITAIELMAAATTSEPTIVSSDDCLFLLNCCCMLPDKPRPEKLALIEQIWHLILTLDSSTAPTRTQLIHLLRAYRSNGKKMDFIEFLQRHPINDIELCNELLYVACEVGNTDGMVTVLSEIRAKKLELTEQTFNALILGHSRSRQLTNCELVVATMVAEANVPPSATTHMELIQAYVENGASDKAIDLLRKHGADFTEPQIISIIKSIIRRDDQSTVLTEAFALLSEDALHNKHILPELRNICIELIHANEARKAFRIIEMLPVPVFSDAEDCDGYATFFLSELIRSGTPVEIVREMAAKLIETKRNTRALHVCCEVALRHDAAEALDYLQALVQSEPLRPHYFWPLFLRNYRSNGESGILTVLTEMNRLQVAPDLETITNYVLPKLPITLKDVRLGIKMLEDKGVRIGQLMTPLLAHLIYSGRLHEAAQQLAEMKNVRIDRAALLWPCMTYVKNIKLATAIDVAALYKPLATLLKMLASKGGNVATTSTAKTNYDLAGYLLMELVSNNARRISYSHLTAFLVELDEASVRISSYAGDMVAQYLMKCTDNEMKRRCEQIVPRICDKRLNLADGEVVGAEDGGGGGGHILHPRDMQLDELECHLVELQSKNLNYRGVLRRLLQLTVRAGKYERALEIKQMCERKNVALSPGMLACILELMIRTKNIDGIKVAADQMSQLYPTFQLDEHKCIDWAALLIENGQIDEAKAILKKRAAASKPRGGSGVQKNIWQLLANTAAKAAAGTAVTTDQNHSKEMLDFLCELGYCDRQNNTLLGPIIREHLLKGEIRQAVAEFETIARQYRKTPLQFELLATLIRISNESESSKSSTIDAAEAKELLERVMNTTSSIHGSINTNVSMVVAFAQSGTEKQLRKVLIDPNVQVNMEAILKQCAYLCGNGTVEPLLRLAKCSRGLSGSVREQDFYNMILEHYVRENDFMAALELFDRVTGDDEFKLTAEFVRNLIALLEKNNLEVPSTVAMLARN